LHVRKIGPAKLLGNSGRRSRSASLRCSRYVLGDAGTLPGGGLPRGVYRPFKSECGINFGHFWQKICKKLCRLQRAFKAFLMDNLQIFCRLRWSLYQRKYGILKEHFNLLDFISWLRPLPPPSRKNTGDAPGQGC
jgi:hypothetical protein